MHGFPLYLVALLYSYITERSFRVKVEAATSNMQKTHAGVPQGTVLSPILFNLYTADIPKYPSTSLAIFADDVLVSASSFYAKVARSHIQNHLHYLLPWYAKWKLKINENKCECTILTRKFTNHIINIPITINNTQVPPAKKLKYLGVILDSRLRFASHTSYILQKGFLAMQNLYAILAPRSPLSPRNKLGTHL